MSDLTEEDLETLWAASRTGAPTHRADVQKLINNLRADRAELERERIQNREAREALTGVVNHLHTGDGCSRCREVLLAARAALSTQEESVQVHVRRDDGPDDTYLVRRASQEAPKA